MGTNEIDYNQLFQEATQLIALGKLAEVQKRLGKLNSSDIPRRLLASFANLSWRSGNPTLSIQLLRKYVRPVKGTLFSASPQENMEYAAALNRLGAFREARELLGAIDQKDFPKKCLYEGFISMSRWEYDLAIPPLTFYQGSLVETDYEWCVASVNLAASLIVLDRIEEARVLLAEVIDILQTQKKLRLLANALELQSQIYVRLNRIDEALQSIERGRSLLGDKDFFEALFFQKWEAIAHMKRDSAKTSLNKLYEVRNSARTMKHWETIRECDLYICSVTKDPLLLNKIYFGTPYPLYRERVCRILECAPLTAVSCILPWSVEGDLHSPKIGERLREFDARSGEYAGKKFINSEGSIYHRLLLVLMRDLYRPTRLTTIHSELYPKIYFDPDSTPNKLYQIIKRLRSDIEGHRIPISIEFMDSNLSVRFLKPVNLCLFQDEPGESRLAQLLKLHFSGVQGEVITSASVAEKLGCSQRQGQRILQQAIQEGLAVEVTNSNNRAKSIRLEFNPIPITKVS